MPPPPLALVPTQAALAALYAGASGVGSDIQDMVRLAGQGAPPPVLNLAGGEVLTKFQNPAFTTFDQEYRVLPDESWYDPNVSPTRPLQFEIGSFQVPNGQALWIMDYEFTPYRMSGFDPGDMVPAEDGRFASIMGFDYLVTNKRTKQILFQLDPNAITLARTAYQQVQNNQPTQRASPDAFNKAASNSFAAASSQGLSLLPTIHRGRQGVLKAPFTIVIRENDRAALNCVIWRTIPTPLGALSGRHMGFLVQTQLSDALINNLRPR